MSVTPKPGELRLWALQAVAHGADGVLFFRWRTARHGAEQFWHGLLEHDGRPGRRYQEIKQLGQELSTVGDALLSSSVSAEVALLLSYDSRFALQIQPQNPGFSYPEQALGLYQAFHQRQVAVDIVPPEADFSRYRLVLAPSLYVLTEETAWALERFVAGGGVLLVGPRSGVKDEANAVVNAPLPGLLSRLCGVTVEDYDALPAGVTQALKFASGDAEAQGRVWCDVLAADGAEVLARYGSDYYADKPALTLNRFGRGKALYLGTLGDAALYAALAQVLLAAAGLSAQTDAPAGIEIARRQRGDRELVFILNHSQEPRVLTLRPEYRSLLGPVPAGGTLGLGANEVAVLEVVPRV